MNQGKSQYLYTIIDQKATKDFSVVGIIDGSGSMKNCWQFLCEAWNEFITDIPSTFCIQFDNKAVLQESPLLTKQLGTTTNISKGFFELIELVKTKKKLKKNVIIVFITDGVGEDKIEDYIDELAEEFELFHEQGFQFKLFTLATGTSFSHTIVAELKNRIHNSTLISSQMEYVLKYETEFKIKLNQIKDEIFYNMVRVEPPVSLVPNGKKLNRVAPNQTIITNSSKIKVNNEAINLEKYHITYHDIYQLANQIMLKLMEDSTRGLDSVSGEAQKQLQIIEQQMKKVKDDSKEFQDLINDINETTKKIKDFAEGKQKLQTLSAVDAAKSITKLQASVIENTKKKQILKAQQLKDEQKEKAIKRLAGLKKTVKIKTVFEKLQQFFLANNNSSPEQLVKLLQEKKGGQELLRYALSFEKECYELFDLLRICNSQ